MEPTEQPQQEPVPTVPVVPTVTEVVDVDAMLKEAFAQGEAIAMIKFFEKHYIQVFPTAKCDNPVMSFARLLLAEATDKDKYPFKESYKAACEDAVDKNKVTIFMCFDMNDLMIVKKLVRLVAIECTLAFLERNNADALSVMRTIRND